MHLDLNEASSIATVAVAAATVTGALWVGGRQVARMVIVAKQVSDIVTEWETMKERQLKTEAMTGAIMALIKSRGEQEAVQRGVAIMNSPAVLTNEARRWMAPFADELRALYETAWVSLDDAMLATMIQNEFGDRLQAEICIPHSITPNAALLMAKAVARGE